MGSIATLSYISLDGLDRSLTGDKEMEDQISSHQRPVLPIIITTTITLSMVIRTTADHLECSTNRITLVDQTSFYLLCQFPRLVLELFSELNGNIPPRSNPHIWLRREILDKILNGLESTGFSRYPAVQGDRHHLRLAPFAFAVQDVECILQVLGEIAWRAPAVWRAEFEIITVIPGQA